MHISTSQTATCDATADVPRAGWKADLKLRFRRTGERSLLAERRHFGPLVVQKALYPEGLSVCHAIIVHPPGGIAGGDELTLTMNVEDGAHALATTPAAGKWYKAGGLPARQDASFTVGDDAVLEWLPLETIVFDGARAGMEWRVDLAPRAAFAAWDVICLGRKASGEAFRTGAYRQAMRIFRDGRQLWGDLIALDGDDPLMRSPVGLDNCPVFGAMIVAAGGVPRDVLERCRALTVDQGCGITALPQIFAARYLGHSAEQARAYFTSLWTELRPWYAGRPAHRPRLWDT